MTTALEAVRNRAAWVKSGTAVEANSAADVVKQVGLDWSVSLHKLNAEIIEPVGPFDSITKQLEVPKKHAVIKTTKDGSQSAIGVVGDRYKVFQNEEIFSSLDTLIESGEARYAAAGEYDGGAKVWMLMSLPRQVEIASDPHAAFLLARTSHDGSCSVIIKPIIERLFCMNQINRVVYKGKNKNTYTLTHTTNSKLVVSDIRNILDIAYTTIDSYQEMAMHLMQKDADTAKAVEYFKKVFPLPTKTEFAPLDSLSKGEKNARSRALTARAKALAIYSESPTQENIRGTEFGLWQAVIEYADHHSSRDAAIATLTQRNDGIKQRALELLTV